MKDIERLSFSIAARGIGIVSSEKPEKITTSNIRDGIDVKIDNLYAGEILSIELRSNSKIGSNEIIVPRSSGVLVEQSDVAPSMFFSWSTIIVFIIVFFANAGSIFYSERRAQWHIKKVEKIAAERREEMAELRGELIKQKDDLKKYDMYIKRIRILYGRRISELIKMNNFLQKTIIELARAGGLKVRESKFISIVSDNFLSKEKVDLDQLADLILFPDHNKMDDVKNVDQSLEFERSVIDEKGKN